LPGLTKAARRVLPRASEDESDENGFRHDQEAAALSLVLLEPLSDGLRLGGPGDSQSHLQSAANAPRFRIADPCAGSGKSSLSMLGYM